MDLGYRGVVSTVLAKKGESSRKLVKSLGSGPGEKDK
jgi:hypothetical protein